jgi:hypothetical protein
MQRWDDLGRVSAGMSPAGAQLHDTQPSGIQAPDAAAGADGVTTPNEPCTACGNALWAGDRYCSACGTSTGAWTTASPPQAPRTRWEYCQITCYTTRFWHPQQRFVGVKQYQTHFIVSGIGPHGLFQVPELDYPGHVYYGSDAEAVERGRAVAGTRANVIAVSALVKALTDHGWEPLPEKGRGWYSYTFRRQTSS